jgi:RHS repeat-associated protein
MKLFKLFSVATCLATANLSVPYGAIATLGTPLRESVERSLKSRVRNQKPKAALSRVLSAKEQRALKGRAGENPYFAGQQKWAVGVKGVDMTSGNYNTSVTDMSFDGGYGIPVNVTRSYSANNGADGPFGKGWTLSADVRSTAGGLLKGPSAPVRSVPVSFKEMSPADSDPNVAVQPTAAVTPVDAAGKAETVQKDVDGILTTPPWDNNVSNPTYQIVTQNGQIYQVQSGNTTTTPDGTVYTYSNEGSYLNGGIVPYSNPSAPPVPSDVLKVTQVVDRQGNVTTYTYGSSPVTYVKSDGTTQENPLIAVQMPNGHSLTFTYGTGTDAGHVVSVSDGIRTVNYGYTNGLLTSVTTPGGKTTTYGYGGAGTLYSFYQQLASYENPVVPYSGPIATGLLTSITDPRGLTTQINYAMGYAGMPCSSGQVDRVLVNNVTDPNGQYTVFTWGGTTSNPWSGFDWSQATSYMWLLVEPGENTYVTMVGNGDATIMDQGCLHYTATPNPTLWISVTGQLEGLGMNLWNWNDSYLPTLWSSDTKIYDPNSENLITDYACDQRNEIDLGYNVPTGKNTVIGTVETDKTYNFMGNPLLVTVSESNASGAFGSPVLVHQATTSYAYWDGTKYFQQKAVMDPGGRYCYTDYYPSTASAGSRGQQYQVYDNAHAGFYLNTSITPPSYAASNDYWKYQLTPAAGQYSAQFAYDSVGRCTDVYKLQSTTTSPWTYVHTQTTYGANTDGSWGQASTVIEDQGGINRLTQTKAYTAWGKACDVVDAAGHEFVTGYDLDGNVLGVTRTDSGLNQTIASYSYGSSGVTNGQVMSVTDGLSGVTDSMAYQTSGGGIGMVSQVTESGGPNPSYSVLYGYHPTGDRATVTYSTVNGTHRWGYYDYVAVGSFGSRSRVPCALVQLDSNSNPTSEAVIYRYDAQGHLVDAVFAISGMAAYKPQADGLYQAQRAGGFWNMQASAYQAYMQSGGTNTSGGFDPSQDTFWLDTSNQPTSFARAHYQYDPGGRVLSVEHDWQVWNGSGYTVTGILQNNCAYEYSGLNRGVKTASQFNVWNGTGWSQDHQESYSYDPNLDYLVGANYGDGLPNATPSWSYDAAGNRTDSVCDNLNRTVSIGGQATTCDILGNRLSLGSGIAYGWDCLSRMTSYTNGGVSNSYWYRADGMRVGKLVGSTGTTTTYAYDGQMGFEDQDTTGSGTKVTDYGLGGRGIDYIASNNGATTTVGFPLYDSHGSMTACVFRGANGTYSLGNQRSYDAWGNVREGLGTGDPKGRYCGNLGHKQDDESGLVYMGARYCDPTAGRFLSEDPGLSGKNWFVYSSDDPVNSVDGSGRDTTPVATAILSLVLSAVGWTLLLQAGAAASRIGYMIALTGIALIVAWFGGTTVNGTALGKGRSLAGDAGNYSALLGATLGAIGMYIGSQLMGLAAAGVQVSWNGGGIAQEAIGALSAYTATLGLFMAMDSLEDAMSG